MTKTKRNQDGTADFWGLFHSYINVYCKTVRALSPKTLEAYRLSLECYIDYLESAEGVGRDGMSFEHFERAHMKGWMAWMSGERGYAPKTVGLRLTAVRSSLDYCAAEDASLTALSGRAKLLKPPRSPRSPIEYLEAGELSAPFNTFGGDTAESRRNRMLLVPLYETAARVPELAGLGLGDVSLSKPAHVTLVGKFNKVRIVPIGPDCVDRLRFYLDEFHPGWRSADPSRPLFYSMRDGEPHALSTDSVALVLKKAGDAARAGCPTLPVRLHPHTLRKSRAMALLKAKVPVPMIMRILGHEHMSTTLAFYAFATVEMMSEAIEGAVPDVLSEKTGWLTEARIDLLNGLK